LIASGLDADWLGDLAILWEDGERVFCRTRRPRDDRTSVLAVLPASAQPLPASLDRLAHEYTLKNELDAAWAARPLELVREHGRIALLLEDHAGEPLARQLGAPMELGRFLRLAIGIAAALAKFHQRGLVHKDIKPSNILIDCPDGQVRLTGFGLASRLARERQAPAPPEFIAGALAYMAPEQTGRMNRSIDSRSDLYAFGVVLYQMLTGTLPFSAADPTEWVHCHVARRPTPPAERLAGLPIAISAIIMKLLAKTAEERYQTAAGVEGDLRRCLAEWSRVGCIVPFPLGERDMPDRLLIPEKLYGRQCEVDALLAAFDRVSGSGASELVLVSGYSGVGKSAVVSELHQALVARHGLFASGKFDQYKREIPYATLAQAFQSLVRSLLGKSEAELDDWRAALLDALGPNGRLLIELVPDLKLVIGEQPPVPELPPLQAQGRFQLTVRRFIAVFARPEQPLTLFLDDLHWLDAATLDLFEDLLTQSDVRHLLLVGAYRANEVDALHPLMRWVQAVREGGAAVTEIVLAPLDDRHLVQLIGESLRCDSERAMPLAQLVLEKTDGNPFFAIQFVAALADEGLLTFDHDAESWSWDLDRIHAKGYTDNVVDLMVGKLARLPAAAQQALQQLACLGNDARISVLALVLGTTDEEAQATLWPAVHQGLVERHEQSYKFIHDRVREAAYSLIPEDACAAAHLRIGRLLATWTPGERREEAVFEIVNQLNRGSSLIAASDERQQLAELNLLAGRRAKASTAYASALTYLTAGLTSLQGGSLEQRHELMFQLALERAECHYLNGSLEDADRLLSTLLRHATTKLEIAQSYRLQIQIHVTGSAYAAAIDCGLEGLRLFGIAIPPLPSREQLDAEYASFWASLAARPIETLIDLPLMTDPERRAVAAILTTLFAPASLTNSLLFYLLIGHGANLTLAEGVSEDTTHIYAGLAQVLGPIFHRYEDGLRFALLGRDLAERHGFGAVKAHFAMQNATVWHRSIQTTIDHTRLGHRSAVDSGDLSYACFFSWRLIAYLLLQGLPLDMVWAQSKEVIELARRINFRDFVDTIGYQQAFVAVMRGERSAASAFEPSPYNMDAAAGEVTGDGAPAVACWYWILRLQARFILRDFAAARDIARKTAALVPASHHYVQWADYVYFAALAIGAVHDAAHPAIQADEIGELQDHQARLQEWARAAPETFLDRCTLVSAEIARLEDHPLDAMRLYDEAIRLARDHGFVHNEAIANEVAARFYTTRGFEKIARTYLRDARYAYLRWGAHGKVRQLDELYPHLVDENQTPGPTGTIGTSVDDLDLATVIKVSQAVSGEIVLEKLIDTLLRMAVEQAGAERGLLILLRGGEPRISAEATTNGSTVAVHLRNDRVDAVLPASVLRYVLRTQETIVLDDAAAPNQFSGDPYFGQRQSRSILCLPLLNRAKLTGVLYLENGLAAHVFAPARTAVLKLLASQAAISVENTYLYRDVMEREARIRRLVDANIIGICIWKIDGQIIEANDAFLRIVGYAHDDLAAGQLHQQMLTPPEWQERDAQTAAKLMTVGTLQPFEKEYRRKDGGRVPVLIGAAMFEAGGEQGVSFVLDLSERKRAEADAREMQIEVARANRVATMGQLTASIAHEVSQPVAAIGTNADAALRWLRRQPPDLEEVQQALARISRDGKRAGDVIVRIRDLVKKAPPRKDGVAINELIVEVAALTRSEATKNAILLRTDLADDLPLIRGDRVQLQQVILNLVLNGIEAMTGLPDGARELRIASGDAEPDRVRVVVADTGPGLDRLDPERLFEPFFTTKPGGLGMGLSICRSIIESHGGRLWASANAPRGAVFQFVVPVGEPRAT
jgi:PAS domain S-box-containing protein